MSKTSRRNNISLYDFANQLFSSLSFSGSMIIIVREALLLLLSITHPTVTSNILLPTELDTAMSPKPFRATMTDVIKSGIEVPAARNVRPIT